MTLELTIEEVNKQQSIVTVRGDIDLSTSADLEACVLGLLDAAASVIVDMEGVTFLDSSGLRSFVSLQSVARAQGSSMALRGLPQRVRRVFDLTGLAASFGLTEE